MVLKDVLKVGWDVIGLKYLWPLYLLQISDLLYNMCQHLHSMPNIVSIPTGRVYTYLKLINQNYHINL